MARQGLRSLDYVFIAFFAIHMPVIIFVDMSGLYPEGTMPAISQTIRKFYIENFQDQFFIDPPKWFVAYTIMEAVYHLPLSVWMLTAILEENPLVPLHMLAFGVQTAVTTMTCLVEVFDWGYSRSDEAKLCSLYGPYLVLALLMVWDSFSRLLSTINAKVKHA